MYGRSSVRFLSGTQIFSLSHARDKLNTPSFSFRCQFKRLNFVLARTRFRPDVTVRLSVKRDKGLKRTTEVGDYSMYKDQRGVRVKLREVNFKTLTLL